MSILYIKATVVFVYPSSFQALPGQIDRHHCGFVFCDSYYPTDKAGASRGGPARARRGAWVGKGRAEWGARAGKDRAGGSSTGALCTKFTLVVVTQDDENIFCFKPSYC
jgi:hypothetical protein